TTNTKADGRFHSNWLNMMYPRLLLARGLLRADGVIMISIDDNEVHNLLSMVTEIFGGENVVGVLVWEKKKKGAFLARHLTNIKEYVVVVARNALSFGGLIGEIATDTETYPCINATNPREIRIIPAGIKSNFSENDYFLPKGSVISSGTMDMVLHSDLAIEAGVLKRQLIIEGNWRYTQENMEQFAKNGELYLTTDLYLRRIVAEPRYKNLKDLLPRVGEDEKADYRQYNPNNLFEDGWGSNEDGEEELRDLLNAQDIFPYPKPMKLIAKLIASVRDPEAIVIDFFAGSCTAAHAILNLNARDNGNRRFIMVQLPEPTGEGSPARQSGYATIADIGKERIRRVIKQMQGEQPKLIPDRETPEDLGFRVFRLERSHFKAWQDYTGGDVAELETLFDRFESPLAEVWTPESLLVEIMLLQGFPLDSAVTPLPACPHNHVLRVTSDLVAHHLYVCLDERLHPATADTLALGAEDVFVCLDSALDEETKLRLQDGRNVVVI
ncbi:MAG: site-specific DNA-methyltransferase, partial [Chloroflexi bacterium]|nr:site-specific DNA-methyltransferase [Chloroflexota bacterium]